MQVEQISVFLENRRGCLAEVTSILAEAGINIRGMSLADTKEFGVLRFILSDCDKAETKLKTMGYSVRRTPVTAVEIPHRPGELYKILSMIDGCEINVEYMYEVADVTPPGTTALIFRFDDQEKAARVLSENKIPVLDGAAFSKT